MTGGGPEQEIRLDVPADLNAMAMVRSQVVEAATRWGFAHLQELEVVTSELLTNAIVHAGSASVLTCSLDPSGAVEVAVTDDAPALPAPGDAEAHATHGRGMRIIEGLSAEWGATPRPEGGKTVWARLT